MLIATKSILACSLENSEETVGTLKDLFFHAQTWCVKLLVVSTGNWLSFRRVLMPPTAVEKEDWPNRRLRVSLTQDQVKQFLSVENHAPVSQQDESKQFPSYVYIPAGPVSRESIFPESKIYDDKQNDIDLHSARELTGKTFITGYQIEAIDGFLGTVNELIVDIKSNVSENWKIRYLAVDTQKLLPDKKVLIDTIFVRLLDWGNHLIKVGLTVAEINKCPVYDTQSPDNIQLEDAN